MFKLDLEKAEEPEIKLPTFVGSLKKQESSRKTSTSAWLTSLKALCGSQQTGKFLTRWEYKTTWPASWGICIQVRKKQNWIWNYRLLPNRERSMSRLLLSPCLFNLYAEYIMRNAGLGEAQAGIKIVRRNINNLRYADDTTLLAESEEAL